VRDENRKWLCQQCREMLCMHKTQCVGCGHLWRG
jgi:hypothetical protein